MSNAKELSGQRFGRLTVIERIGSKNRCILWKCKCDCGNETEVISNVLVNGHTKSCGCLKDEAFLKRNTKHGQADTRLYKIWQGMIQRCTNHNYTGYKNYGGRGICVCDEWLNFITFYIWATRNGYDSVLSIDRVNNNGNYEASNCRWSNRIEQNNNSRHNVCLEYNGQTKTIHQWSDVLGISYANLQRRIKTGWTVEKAFNTPVKAYKTYAKRR